MLIELEIDSNPKRARTRVNGRSRVGAPVSFPILFSSRFDLNAMAGFFRVGSGDRSRVLPKECRAFFPKTTVSWL